MRAKKTMTAVMLAACALAGTSAVPAAAASVLLPHPGPEGLVWVEEMRGDGGVASGGAWEGLPTVLTVACEGEGEADGGVRVTMRQQAQVAAFAVDCPVGSAGVGSVTMEPGVVKSGSFTIDVDASGDDIRWALTVTQPE
ncbi:hypothetical protein [Streptomyces omiyaensis]|uniref:Secreted protein n=1 Tax=Streptomyces omiyaensis TaxID=68247 RepID=A0ABW7BKM2_9ACTN|nr:hypothetical protein [Streptomyces omiyaensis]GGY54442.1 hypothetical protein GCM10010363_39540 [Streptomyces omiyaensis]